MADTARMGLPLYKPSWVKGDVSPTLGQNHDALEAQAGYIQEGTGSEESQCERQEPETARRGRGSSCRKAQAPVARCPGLLYSRQIVLRLCTEHAPTEISVIL